MLLSPRASAEPGTPPALRVSPRLQAELRAARTDAVASARTWSAGHRGAPIDGFLDQLFDELPAAPGGAARDAELGRVLRSSHGSSAQTHEVASWYGRFGQAGTQRPNFWRSLLDEYRAHELARLGPVDGAVSAARGAALVDDAIRAANSVVWRSKPLAHEARPYVLDPSVTPPAGGWPDSAFESHPSGHAATAAAAATVLGALWPERRASFDLLADRVSYARILDEMHFPHDVVEGTRIGVAAATAVLGGDQRIRVRSSVRSSA